MLKMKNVVLGLIVLSTLVGLVGCQGDQKKDSPLPIVLTAKTQLCYTQLTKEDLDGTSTCPVAMDQKCLKKIKETNKFSSVNACRFAGDLILFGKVVDAGFINGCFNNKFDEYGGRYRYKLEVLHVFAGEYKKKTIWISENAYAIRDYKGQIGDTILASAFTDGHDKWFMSEFIVAKPNDKIPFKKRRRRGMDLPCFVYSLPKNVGEMDKLFKEIHDSSTYKTVCPYSQDIDMFRESVLNDFRKHVKGYAGYPCVPQRF